MDKLADYSKTIAQAYPDLTIRTARFHNGDGQFNEILIVNEAFIFRFPRYSKDAERLKNEVRFLSRIQGKLPLPIPDPIYSQFDFPDPSQTFMGYRMLPGEPIWQDTLVTLENTALEKIADQMAEFLIALHNIPVEAHDGDLPVYDRLEEWMAMYDEFREFLYPFMRSEARLSVSMHFENYLSNPQLHVFTPCFRHGDFGTGNILIGPEDNVLCGVIDFGFAGIGDPAIDIAAISALDKRLFDRFKKVYPTIDPLLERAAFYKGTYALQEALHGIKNGDREAFESGIADYR